MARFDDMARVLKPFAPNLPDFTGGNALRDAARRYFQEVHAYQVDDFIGVIPGISGYDVDDPDDNVEVVSVLGLQRSEWDKLSPLSQPPSYRVTGQPRHFYGHRSEQIRVFPEPEKAETLTVIYAVRPAFDAEEMDTKVMQDNIDALKYGALAILKGQPQVEWSAPDEVGYYQQLFDQEVNARRIEAMTSGVSYQTTAQIPDFL